MSLFIVVLSSLLAWCCVIHPSIRARRLAEERYTQQRLRYFKLYAVKKYHPAFGDTGPLAHLNYDEIARRYNVSELYEKIGN